MVNEKAITNLRELILDCDTINLKGPQLAQMACKAAGATKVTDMYAYVNGTPVDLYDAATMVTGLPEDLFYFDQWPKDYQLLSKKNAQAAALVAITWYLEEAKEIEDGILV